MTTPRMPRETDRRVLATDAARHQCAILAARYRAQLRALPSDDAARADLVRRLSHVRKLTRDLERAQADLYRGRREPRA